MNLECDHATKILTVDGQDIIIEYCDKAIITISIDTPLMRVELSDTCGFCIESEQGTVYLHENVNKAVSEFAQAEGLTYH